MKNHLTLALATIALSISPYLLPPSPTLAQGNKPKVRFYCGYTQDGKLTPTTLAAQIGVKGEPTEMVRWTDYKKQTAEQRCQAGSSGFQAAWNRGDFNRLVTTTTSSGEGAICALSYGHKTCDRVHLLFLLNSSTAGNEVIGQIRRVMRGEIGSKPPTQSTDANEIDMQEFIASLNRSK
jgi:Circadian oscillating protein COP23